MMFSRIFSLDTALFLMLLCACTASNEQKVIPLRLSLIDDIRMIDPALGTDVSSAEVIGHIFEGLLSFSYTPDLSKIEAALAKEIPQPSAKGTQYVFELREDIYFQADPAFQNGQGRLIGAEDVVYSIKRLLDPRLNSPNAWLFQDQLQGIDAWQKEISKANKGEGQEAAFEKTLLGVTALDARHVQFLLKVPSKQFLYNLAMNQASIVAKEVIQKWGSDTSRHPVGSGPYQLSQWVPGSRIILKASPSYRFKKDVQIQNIQWDIIKEEMPRWYKLVQNELDMALLPKDVFKDVIDAQGQLNTEMQSKNLRLYKNLTLTTFWIEFNLMDPIVGPNLHLRKALAYAMDRKKALELLYNNRGLIANSPLPPNIEGGDQITQAPYDFQLELAQKELALAGYNKDHPAPELSFDLRGPGSVNRQMGELLQENFSKIGVKLKIIANAYTEAIDKQKSSRFQMVLGGWAADYPDPETYLANFISVNKAPGPNTSLYSNPEYEKLYTSMKSMESGPERVKLIKKMLDILNQDIPVIFFYHPVEYKVVNTRIQNFIYNPLFYGPARFYKVNP